MIQLTQLRESDKFTPLIASLGDELDGLQNTFFQVKPAGLGLNTGSFVLADSSNHFYAKVYGF
jgi:hypothetical protein